LTIINNIPFGLHTRYKLEKIIEVLKEKNNYYRCRICKKKYVKKEGEICESCKYKVEVKP